MAETRTAARMARLVAQWRRSGESGASFARRHRIPTWTFWYWRRKLSATPSAEPPRVPFVPVQVAVDDSPVMELVFSGGGAPAGPRRRLGGVGAGGRERPAVGVLTLSPAVRIYLATGATDLRRSIDGLAALVRERFDLDPLSGHLFLFRNRRGDRLKILAWDHGGFWVLYKRLERGTFAWPAEDEGDPVTMRSGDLVLLLSGIDLAHTRRRRWYERAA
jgi:transposase